MSDLFIDLYVKSISKDLFVDYLSQFIRQVENGTIEIGDDTNKVANQLKWSKIFTSEKQIAFSTFLAVATYIYGTLNSVPELKQKYWNVDDVQQLILENFKLILNNVQSNVIAYKSPLTTTQFKNFDTMRKEYDFSQTKLQKPLYDLLNKARIWYNTRSSYINDLETNYAFKVDYCMRRMDEVKEMIKFCAASTTCKPLLDVLNPILKQYEDIYSELKEIGTQVNEFSSNPPSSADKVLSVYKELENNLRNITIPPFNANDRRWKPIADEFKLIKSQRNALKNYLAYWETSKQFKLMVHVYGTYIINMSILPRTIHQSIKTIQNDYDNAMKTIENVKRFLEETENNITLSIAHDVHEKTKRFEHELNESVRIPLLDHEELYTQTLNEMENFMNQHTELVKKHDELLQAVNGLETNLTKLTVLDEQLKTLKYLDTNRTLVHTGEKLLSEFKQLKKDTPPKPNTSSKQNTPSKQTSFDDIVESISYTKQKESQLNSLLSAYATWMNSYTLTVEKAHQHKVSSLVALKNTYAKQLVDLATKLNDARKRLELYKTRPGIDSFKNQLNKFLSQINQLNSDLIKFNQLIDAEIINSDMVLNESDLIKLNKSLVDNAEQLKKNIQQTLTSIWSYTISLENNLSDPEKPPVARVWDSVTGETWARAMDSVFKESGSTLGMTYSDAKNQIIKRNALLAASAVGITAIVYYLYWKGKRYLKKRNLLQRIDSLKPKMTWIVIQPYSRETMQPISSKSSELYDDVVDVIKSSLNPSNQLIIQQRKSKRSKVEVGVQTLLSLDIIPDVQNFLLDELKRKGLTNDQLIASAPHSSSQVYLPVLI
jgi:hypothetical protein